jgi:hypothetical protein
MREFIIYVQGEGEALQFAHAGSSLGAVQMKINLAAQLECDFFQSGAFISESLNIIVLAAAAPRISVDSNRGDRNREVQPQKQFFYFAWCDPDLISHL